MAIYTESTTQRILVSIQNKSFANFILQRKFYKKQNWETLTDDGYIAILPTQEQLESDFSENEIEVEEKPKILLLKNGDFVDSFNLENGLYEYRYIPLDTIKEIYEIESVEELTQEQLDNIDGSKWIYSEWCRFGNSDCIGYSFGNYEAPQGKWGTIATPDDLRYTYLWGTDFKAANGDFFDDAQIQYFIDSAVKYMERELNITIKKRVIKCNAKKRNLIKTTKWIEGDYDVEESPYDFNFRKIQRYGMIRTLQRPIIDIERLELTYRSKDVRQNLLENTEIDYKKGIIKFLQRPWRQSQKYDGISNALEMYGNQTFNAQMFYEIDYSAGFENSDEVPEDLREIIAKVAAVSLLNVIGDGLMSGFSSSSLSMDGISESFSSTQSATSSYYGARIQVYRDEIKAYIQENKYKFSNLPIAFL